MSLRWTKASRGDLLRVYSFLAGVNPRAAMRNMRAIRSMAHKLPEFPRVGQRLPEFSPREVRRVIAGNYEIRYEVSETDVLVLRVWHVHEDR